MKPLTLSLFAAVLVMGGCASTPTSTPHRVDQDAAWLDRLTWGASSSSLAELRRRGRAAWLDSQLAPRSSLAAGVQAQIADLTVGRNDFPAVVYELENQRKDANAVKDETEKAAAQKATSRR